MLGFCKSGYKYLGLGSHQPVFAQIINKSIRKISCPFVALYVCVYAHCVHVLCNSILHYVVELQITISSV